MVASNQPHLVLTVACRGTPAFRLFSRAMSGADISLGGAWNGRYFYPDYPDGVTFVALLIDAGYQFSGSIHEYEGIISEQRILLYATVDGRREGREVSFFKTYDGTGGWEHTVHYGGTLSGDGTEIAGRWHAGTNSGASS